MKLGPYELDQIYTGDCAKVMATWPNACIDLTVTSPPYDNLRTYNEYEFDFKAIARQLYRITKLGGVVVWVVGDATINGSETGTSFKEALYFMECGFKLHDTMIYESDKQPLNGNRYEPKFEYMFVLSNGSPKTFNAILERSTYAGQKCSPIELNPDGTKKPWWGNGIVKETKVKGNIWYFVTGKNKSTKDSVGIHPAIFPEALARDHILSWSNPGDTVLDPMCGSGTTLKMAKEFGRHWIGIDISQEYVDLSLQRVDGARVPLDLDRLPALQPEQLELEAMA